MPKPVGSTTELQIISASVPVEVVNAIDEEARRRSTSRASVMRQLISDWARHRR